MTTRKNIDTLQMIRCFAILGICLSHTDFLLFKSLGAWGTSLFFILSGFVMTYNFFESNKINSVSIKDNAHFAIKKIKPLYPLYIITTLLMFCRLIIGEEAISIHIALIRLVLNIFLMQTWLPFSDAALNGPAWFLSAIVISYFLFPYINTYMEKKYTKRKALCMIIVSIALQYVICLIGSKLPSITNFELLATPELLQEWIVYNAPISRFFDFFIGSNLSYIFINKRHDLSITIYSILELLSIILVFVSNLVSSKLDDSVFLGEKRVIVFTFGVIVLLYAFAVGKGKISNVLTNKVTVYVGNISSCIFLIHMPIFTYIYVFIYRIPFINGKTILDKYYSWIEVTIGFIIVIILSEVYIRTVRHRSYAGKK